MRRECCQRLAFFNRDATVRNVRILKRIQPRLRRDQHHRTAVRQDMRDLHMFEQRVDRHMD